MLRTYRSRIIAYGLLLVLFLVASQFYAYQNAQVLLQEESLGHVQRSGKLFQYYIGLQKSELERFAAIIRDDEELKQYVFIIENFESGQDVLPEIYEKRFGWLPVDRAVITTLANNVVLGAEHNDLVESIAGQSGVPASRAAYWVFADHVELVASAPMYYQGNHIANVTLSQVVDAQWLNQQVNNGLAHLQLEVQGRVLMSTFDTAVETDNAYGVKTLSIDGAGHMFAPVEINAPSDRSIRVWVGIASDKVSASLDNYSRQSLYQIIASLVVTLLLGAVITRSMEKPIKYLTSMSAEIAKGKLPKIEKSKRMGELAELTNQFAEMVTALKDKDDEVRSAQRRLEQHAVTDALTGIYNRRAFESALDKVIENAGYGTRRHAVCYIDLDKFKDVNDACGHEAGDKLLMQVTGLIESRVRGTDVMARLGGDEFGLIINDVEEDQAMSVAAELVDLIHQLRFVWQGRAFTIGASIGVVMIDVASGDRAEVLRKADIACYAAKNGGRNQALLYQASTAEAGESSDTARSLDYLEHALKNNLFELHCQSILALTASREMSHKEILLRMRNDRGALVRPGAFMPVAERYGVSCDIDRWVIEHSFEYMAVHKDELNGMVLSINLSATSINEAAMCQFIKSRLLKYGVPPQQLCFELNESVVIGDFIQASAFIETVKTLGCMVALDDYGTGVCSYQLLRDLPVDFVKLDGVFSKRLIVKEYDEAIVASIQSVAEILGIQTVAKNVQDIATVSKLRGMGLSYAQGYVIDKPKPLAQVGTQALPMLKGVANG